MIFKPLLLVLSISTAAASANALADGSVSDNEMTPWHRMMENVPVLHGAVIAGQSIAESTIDTAQQIHTFMPFQHRMSKVLRLKAKTELSVGCNGVNFSGVVDGSLKQYEEALTAALANWKNLTILALAYSQPVLKNLMDKMNQSIEFGIDGLDDICGAVRKAADAHRQSKEQTAAEADCATAAGYKSVSCMTTNGIDKHVIKNIDKMSNWIETQSGKALAQVPGSWDAYASAHLSYTNKSKNSAWSLSSKDGKGGSSGSGGGSGSGSGSSGQGGSKTKCAPNLSPTLALILADAAATNCQEIVRSAVLLPSFEIVKGTGEMKFTPPAKTLPQLSAEITKEFYDIHFAVYEEKPADFANSDAYKELVNRTGVPIPLYEHQYMNDLSRTSPTKFVKTLQNLAMASMFKELEDAILTASVSVRDGLLRNQDEDKIPAEARTGYIEAIGILEQEYLTLRNKVEHDIRRNMIFTHQN